jgi:hypothetical protein
MFYNFQHKNFEVFVVKSIPQYFLKKFFGRPGELSVSHLQSSALTSF